MILLFPSFLPSFLPPPFRPSSLTHSYHCFPPCGAWGDGHSPLRTSPAPPAPQQTFLPRRRTPKSPKTNAVHVLLRRTHPSKNNWPCYSQCGYWRRRAQAYRTTLLSEARHWHQGQSRQTPPIHTSTHKTVLTQYRKCFTWLVGQGFASPVLWIRQCTTCRGICGGGRCGTVKGQATHGKQNKRGRA